MELSEVIIRVPQSRLSSAAWILAQSPEIAADALDISAGAYNAVHRELCNGELSKHLRVRAQGSHNSDDILLHVHQSLELGCLDEIGGGFFLWTYTPNGGPEMRCIMRVTTAPRTDVKLDVAKHIQALQREVAAGNATCAVFISLACKIPNTRSVDLQIVSGVPLMYFSSDTSGEMSEVALVTMAFRVMSQLARTLQGQTADAYATAIDVSKNIKSQIARLDQVDAQICAAGKVQKDLLDLREDMVRDILALKTVSQPVCQSSEQFRQEDLQKPLLLQPESEQITLLVSAYRTSKKRNPTNYNVLRIDESLRAYVKSLVDQNIAISHFIAEAKKAEKTHDEELKSSEVPSLESPLDAVTSEVTNDRTVEVGNHVQEPSDRSQKKAKRDHSS